MTQRLGSHYQRYIQTQFTESNSNQFEANNYNNVYLPSYNQHLSTINESNIQYVPECYYLTVSSKDRDRNSYPNVNKYVIHLQTEFKNIYSIELVQAIIPDQNNVTSEPYLLLKMDEIGDVMSSVDKVISDSFAILQLAPPTVPGSFIQIDKRIHENTVKYFYGTPKISLSKLSITVTDVDGNPFDFGADSSPPNDPTKALQNTFIFKVVCLKKKREELDQRNVY